MSAPFIFAILKDAVMFKAPNAVEGGLALFPLEKEEPRVEEQAEIVLLNDDDDKDE